MEKVVKNIKKYLPIVFSGVMLFAFLVIIQIVDDQFFSKSFDFLKETPSQEFSDRVSNYLSEAIWTTIDNDTLAPGKASTKKVIVFFWASWCENCMKKISEMNIKYIADSLQNGEQQDLMISINLDDDVSKAMMLKKKLNIRFPIVHDNGRYISKIFDISAIPDFFVFENGTLVRRTNDYK